MPQDILVLVILGLILGGAVAHLVRAKKRGQKCVGCPYAGSCGSQDGCTGCGGSHMK